MKLAEVQQILAAELICGGECMEREVLSACGADLMSDVLAFTKEKTLLLTGLTNVQTIRTAEMSDLAGIVFVRGKCPGEDTVEMARAKAIPLLVCRYPMFEACGLLYAQGIIGCSQVEMANS